MVKTAQTIEPGVQAFMMPVSKKMYEAIQGIAHKRQKAINELIDQNVNMIEKWFMENASYIGKIFGYSIKVNPMNPESNEIIREKIVLSKYKNEKDSVMFIVTKDEAPEDLFSMLPKMPGPHQNPDMYQWNVKKKEDNDKPTYIG